MSDLFARRSELMQNLEVIFIEDRDQAIEIDNEDKVLILYNLEDLAATYLLIIDYFVVFNINQTKMTAYTDQYAIFEGKHCVISRVTISNCIDFRMYFGRMYSNAMDGCVLLHCVCNNKLF
jgi:hypothetical protein